MRCELAPTRNSPARRPATATRFLRGLAEANVTNYTRCVFQRVNKVKCHDTYGEKLWSKDEAFALWNHVSSWGALISFSSFLLFFGIVIYTVRKGAPATERNPWNEYADTLEWTLPSPPPEHTFEQLPKREDWDKQHAH